MRQNLLTLQNHLQSRLEKVTEWWIVMGLFVLALGVRLMAGVLLPAELMSGAMSDRFQYHRLATNLLETGIYGFEAGVPDQSLPPGYPLFLAGVYALFDTTVDGIGVRLAQSLIGAFTVALVYWLARLVSPRSQVVAIAAAALAALHPILIFFGQVQLTETLYILVIVAGLALTMLALQEANPWMMFCAGLVWGLSLLIREVLIVFPVVMILGLLLFESRAAQPNLQEPIQKRRGLYVLTLLIGVAVAVAPWMARNALISTDSALALTGRADYAVNRITGQDIGTYQSLEDQLDAASQRSQLNAMRYANFRVMLDPSFVLADPAYYLWLVGARLEYVWLHPNGLESLPWEYARTLYRVLHGLVLALALWGIVVAIRRRLAFVWVPILLWLYLIGFHLFVSTAAPRYSLPSVPVMMIFLAIGLSGLFSTVADQPERDVTNLNSESLNLYADKRNR